MPEAREQKSTPAERAVYVIDDDHAVKETRFGRRSRSYGIAAHPYASGVTFLRDLPPEYGCLLVGVNIPGMNGLDFSQ